MSFLTRSEVEAAVKAITGRAILVEGRWFIGARVPRRHVKAVEDLFCRERSFGVAYRVDPLKWHEYITLWGVKWKGGA